MNQNESQVEKPRTKSYGSNKRGKELKNSPDK